MSLIKNQIATLLAKTDNSIVRSKSLDAHPVIPIGGRKQLPPLPSPSSGRKCTWKNHVNFLTQPDSAQ